MDTSSPSQQTDGVSPRPPWDSLVEALQNLPFQFSGRYHYNGGASAREGRGFVHLGSGTSRAALDNPRYRLAEPVYLEDEAETRLGQWSTDPLSFTLHIDIDGPEPLNVVSGTVARGPAVPGEAFPHFVGRVVSNRSASNGRRLVVRDVRFRWPDSVFTINEIKVKLSGSPLVTPTARVTFHDTEQGRKFGPFVVAQSSIYFREVEMDVDRESNALDVEPITTHAHPDRPADLPQQTLTLERAFAQAGIRITRSQDSGSIIDTAEAGANKRWNYSELHDSMQLHWAAFANKPQWKMWIFLAEVADKDSLGGVMFDGEIDEPGGVDRQGTAIFTRCPYFHTVEGEYIKANPPEAEAVKRELFFNLMHETGHAFNLAHSFQKEQGGPWAPPAWMPLTNNNQALSWMNYPDQATPNASGGANATWFYRRFRFRFDDSELLFLRHAPETYVQMGAQAWYQHHGRVARLSLDQRLELVVRARKQLYEFGEPVLVELRLRNVSPQPVMVHRNLDPSDGLVELAVTNPQGERRPFLPVDHTRTTLMLHQLQAAERGIYESVDLTMGSFGFTFKEPGAYRIEASYTNIDGGTAAAVLQIYVRPPATFDVVPVVNELFDARVGTTLYVEGTRVMGDVNEKLDWIRERLDEQLGSANPISTHLTTVRFKPLANASKVVEPLTDSIRVFDEEPDRLVKEFDPVLIDRPAVVADTMGHIWYREIVNTYTACAVEVREVPKALAAEQQMLALFKQRNVVPAVVEEVEQRVAELKAQSRGGRQRSQAARTSKNKD